MSCAIPHQSPIKNTPKKPLLAYDQKYSLEMSSEEIETLERFPLNNSDLNGTILAPKDRARPNTTHPMPHDG